MSRDRDAFVDCKIWMVGLLKDLEVSPAISDRPLILRRVLCSELCDEYGETMKILREKSSGELNEYSPGLAERFTTFQALDERDKKIVTNVVEMNRINYSWKVMAALPSRTRWYFNIFQTEMPLYRSCLVGVATAFLINRLMKNSKVPLWRQALLAMGTSGVLGGLLG
jgi:hypothetical protein